MPHSGIARQALQLEVCGHEATAIAASAAGSAIAFIIAGLTKNPGYHLPRARANGLTLNSLEQTDSRCPLYQEEFASVSSLGFELARNIIIRYSPLNLTTNHEFPSPAIRSRFVYLSCPWVLAIAQTGLNRY